MEITSGWRLPLTSSGSWRVVRQSGSNASSLHQDLWGGGFTGEGETIAVVDTGIDVGHEQFEGKVLERIDLCPVEKILFDLCKLGDASWFSGFRVYAKRGNIYERVLRAVCTVLDPSCKEIDHDLYKRKTAPYRDRWGHFDVDGFLSERLDYAIHDDRKFFFKRNYSRVITSGHGTHCAGIAAGLDTGRACGVALKAKLIDLNVSSDILDGLHYVEDALRWLLVFGRQNGCRVVSLSLGSPNPDAVQKRLVESLHENGFIIVAAVGNSQQTESNKTKSIIQYPSRYPDVISIGASNKSNRRDELAPFSEEGLNIDMVAQGVNVHSAMANTTNRYLRLSGTSMATPLVAGVVACIARHIETLPCGARGKPLRRKVAYFLSKCCGSCWVSGRKQRMPFDPRCGFGALSRVRPASASRIMRSMPAQWKIERL